MHHPPPPLPARTVKSRRTPWRKALLVTCLLVAVLLTVLWTAHSRDEASPDLTDIIIHPLDLTDKDNAYAQLAEVATTLPNFDRQPESDDYSLDELAKNPIPETLELRSRFAREASMAWPEVNRALIISHSQAPWPKSVRDEVPDIPSLRQLSRYALIDAHLLATRGDLAAAFERLFTVIKAGRCIEHSRGTLLHHLLGAAIAKDGTQAIARLAESTQDPLLLLRTAERLEQCRTTTDGLIEAMRNELNFFDMVIEAIRQGDVNVLSDGNPFVSRVAVKSSLVFKPNKTRRLYAEVIRRQISLAGKDAATINAGAGTRFFPRHWTAWLRLENIVGRLILDICIPTWSRISLTYNRDQSLISATQALLAVRAYQIDHHDALPDTLDALVPDYLPSVPLDYMDFAPIRYSKEQRVIWSIGTGGDFDATAAGADKDEPSQILLRIP